MADSITHTISSSLTFETAPGLLDQSRSWLQPGAGDVVFDLSSAGRTDSAGIALMLEWIDMARRNELQLSFTNIPVQTREFIQANGLEKLFAQYTG